MSSSRRKWLRRHKVRVMVLAMNSLRRKAGAFLLAAGLLCGASLWFTVSPASAHAFNGYGDCTSWTLVLDGTFGAHTILIDGVAQPTVALSYVIADESSATTRSFTVKWDKVRDDVVKERTLSRVLNCATTTVPETTTTVPETTTTVPETTTTVEVTTTVPETTTTVPETTTTVPETTTTVEVTTTVPETTTTVGETTTTEQVTTTAPGLTVPGPTVPPTIGTPTSTERELPRTGIDAWYLFAAAIVCLTVGALLVGRSERT